jgi:hypothetical protein
MVVCRNPVVEANSAWREKEEEGGSNSLCAEPEATDKGSNAASAGRSAEKQCTSTGSREGMAARPVARRATALETVDGTPKAASTAWRALESSAGMPCRDAMAGPAGEEAPPRGEGTPRAAGEGVAGELEKFRAYAGVL